MSGDVADSTDAQSALSQVETGKGLLFWGQKQKSKGGGYCNSWNNESLIRFMYPFWLGLSANQTQRLSQEVKTFPRDVGMILEPLNSRHWSTVERSLWN